MSLASGFRKKPNGPMGMMSGSRNKLRRNGSTAASESGPPSWNNTTPTFFLAANQFPCLPEFFKRSRSRRSPAMRLAIVR